MTVKVKICGLRTLQALDAALEAGADYVGLVFYPPSPRNVSIDAARELAARARGRAKSVALLVDADDGQINDILDAVDPDLVQLHGHETPQRVEEIKNLCSRPVIKAIRIGTRDDVAEADRYARSADIILYDAREPEDAPDALPGGNGVPFDWQAFADAKKSSGFMLSGGLNPDNVAQAIELTAAPMVDVSSGVESAPGEKDAELIRRFIAAAKAAQQES